MSPRVSVLIPTYNTGRYIGSALESVLGQTYQDLEIIVLDDGSTDNTREVVAGYPQVRYIYHEHSGIPITRNRAISEAKGEFVVFLDADDLWEPDKLQKQVDYMDSHPDCQLVYTLVRNFFDGQPENMTERQEQLLNANMDNCLVTCCIRRSLYEKHGGYREDYPYGEDTQWVARLWALGINMKHCIQEPLYLRRIHDANISLTHRKVEQKNIMTLLADAIRQARREKKE